MRAFGGVRAVDGATFDVEAGSITGLIGPNGAGKSTLFNCISGFLRPQSGQVLLDGQRIDRRAPHRIARAGLVRTFQTPRALTRMTVLENVVARGAAAHRASDSAASLAPQRAQARARGAGARAPSCSSSSASRVRGRARRHALGRSAQAARPRARADGGARACAPRRADGGRQPDAARASCSSTSSRCASATVMTFLIVEHDLDFVMRASDRVVVMNDGRVIASRDTRRGAQSTSGSSTPISACVTRSHEPPRGRRARGGLRRRLRAARRLAQGRRRARSSR